MKRRTASDLDSPWKEALEHFLPQFLAFFYSTIHDGIDWSKGYQSLDKELQRIVHNARVGRRLADKLFKVWLKSGKEAWLLIHVEVQGSREKAFAERMFIYSYRIYDLYHKPVVSIAVLCDDEPGWKPESFSYNMWGCEVGIRFLAAKMLEYRGREEHLEKDRNPFAALVLAQLKAIETRRSPTERSAWKIRLIKGLYDRGLDGEAIRQLFRLIDWMLTLPDELEQGFRQEIDRFEEERKMPYVTSVERLAKRDGLLEGITLALTARFAAEGKRFVKEVEAVRDYEQLRKVARAVQKAQTLDEIRRVMQQ